ncbi:MAG: hypothetical protein FJX63_01505, partial [Alphaproteobacteria bacterium]|nr:hypothetical protein [Alphaproteobacteria bacterium]
RVLKLFPIEAGITPGFSIMSEETIKAELERALRAVARRHRDDAVAEALAETTRIIDETTCLDLLGRIYRQRTSLGLFLAGDGAEGLRSALCTLLELPDGQTSEDVMAGLKADRSAYARLSEVLRRGTKTDRERAELIDGVIDREVTLIDLDGLFLTADKKPRQQGGLITKSLAGAEPWALEVMQAEQQRLLAGLDALADTDRIGATLALMRVAAAVIKELASRKRRANLLDFEDLIIHVNRLLSSRPEAAWVLYKLDGGIAHLLIDEAQDTSPAQWMIIRSLTEEFFSGAGKLPATAKTIFAVGDHKQSIFRFQGADPINFGRMNHYFAERSQGAQQPFETPLLTLSYRSTPEILKAVDLVFDDGTNARARLMGDDASPIVHQAHRDKHVGTVELWPLVEEAEEPERTPLTRPVDHVPASAAHRQLAILVAEKVASWIGRRLLLPENRAVRPGDILILVRRRNRLFEALIRELRRRGVPVAGADRLRVHEHIAVLDLVAAARFCLAPGDDYTLACVLKSPLIAEPLSEEELMDLAVGRGEASLWQALSSSAAPRLVAAAATITGWMDEARRRRPFEFLSGLARDSMQAFLRRLGGEAADAIEAFLELAFGYEDQATPSLAGFLLWFAEQEMEIKRDMDQNRSDVRIMTVHGAKGLQSHIVILPDTTDVPSRQLEGPLLFVGHPDQSVKLPLWRLPGHRLSAAFERRWQPIEEEMASEFRRLLYVAMTRARDELFICGYQSRSDVPGDSWYRMIEVTLKGAMRQVEDGVLRLGADPQFAVGMGAAPPAAEPAADRVEKPLPGPAPEEAPVSPSKLGGLAAGARENRRVSCGLAIHEALRLLAEAAQGERDAMIRGLSRSLPEGESVAAELARVIADPVCREILDARGVSEVPIETKPVGGGLAIAGRIDRLLVRDHELVIVDYKTDRHWPSRPEDVRAEYLAQLAAYAEALRAVDGSLPIRCEILWTAGARRMPIPEGLLGMGALRETKAAT